MFCSMIQLSGGHSWANFKTLELSEGLEDLNRVLPEGRGPHRLSQFRF